VPMLGPVWHVVVTCNSGACFEALSVCCMEGEACQAVLCGMCSCCDAGKPE
jgi:hypothetical protein